MMDSKQPVWTDQDDDAWQALTGRNDEWEGIVLVAVPEERKAFRDWLLCQPGGECDAMGGVADVTLLHQALLEAKVGYAAEDEACMAPEIWWGLEELAAAFRTPMGELEAMAASGRLRMATIGGRRVSRQLWLWQGIFGTGEGVAA